jgi:polysaccharide pyruvyl transferase WcaK-like protein
MPKRTPAQSPRIAVFGHYGNQNLGDEAIVEAVLRNLRTYIPDAELSCFSINPADSSPRHNVDSFPIRYRADYFNPAPSSGSDTSEEPLAQQTTDQPLPAQRSWKARVKALPLLGPLLTLAQQVVEFFPVLRQELFFLRAARKRLDTVDLVLVTGSNQFLDNFGGPWGFPYTLLKWTWLAKGAGARVGFISVGAGPLSHSLSYWMLRKALSRADFISFRDEGSRKLILEKVGIDGSIYPDLAHSLYGSEAPPDRRPKSDEFRVAVNPMPVYDSRYWHHPDDVRYRDYVQKVASLCSDIMASGARLTLFSTQIRDEAVIEDVIELVNADTAAFPEPEIARNRTVSELMDTLNNADCVVATRFHATVLPLQLGIPVLGICYYRKAAELLEDVGLGRYYVNIDDFDAETLIAKFNALREQIASGDLEISEQHSRYLVALSEQYQKIAALVNTGGSQ